MPDFLNWRRGEPLRILPGQDDSGLTHWRRGEPLLALDLKGTITATGGSESAPQQSGGTATQTLLGGRGSPGVVFQRVLVPVTAKGGSRQRGQVARLDYATNDDDLVLQIMFSD